MAKHNHIRELTEEVTEETPNVSRAVASLCDSQQLDDRIRFVIKQLKLAEPPKPEGKVRPLGPDADPVWADDPEGPDGHPDVPAPRAAARPRRGKKKWPVDKGGWIKLISEWAAADPTGDKGAYLQWIVKMVMNGSLTFPEDINKCSEALSDFERLKAKGGFQGNKDIFSYKSFADMFNTVQTNSHLKSKGEQEREGFPNLDIPGAEIVAQGPVVQRDLNNDGQVVKLTPLGEGRVVRVDSHEAGNKLFSQTRGVSWCVVVANLFTSASYGPPYYMVELKALGTDTWKPKFLHDRKSMNLKRSDDTDANLRDMKPYSKLLKQAGILDDKRGLEYMLGTANVRENRPLAFLSVLESDDKDLIRKAHAHISKSIVLAAPVAH